MQRLQQTLILVLAGFGLGFTAFSVAQVHQRKLRTAVFLAEAEGQLKHLRGRLQAFKAERGRWPLSPSEMLAAGFWTPERPPVERLRGKADWVSRFDGQGGFLYLSASGQVFLNTDLTREKLLGSDIAKLKSGELVPPGSFF